MLQFNKMQSETGREPASDSISAAEALKFIVSFFRRQSNVILFTTFLTAALGVIYLVTARPIFTGQVQLLIDTHKVQGLQVSPQLPVIPADAAQVESQVGVLKSENIASAVINKLQLTQDPEFIKPGGDLLAAISSFFSGEFESADQAAPSEFELFRRAMGAFKSRLTVTRITPSYIIQIDFRSYSAERAAQIANAIADAYIVDQLEAKYRATRQAGGWLQDRIKELRTQVSDAERAVVQFKAKHNIVSTGGTNRPLLNQQQITELSSQLTIARANTAETQARLDRINSITKTDLSDRSLPDASFGATVTDTLKNEIVTKLWGQYLDLAALEANWSAKYGASHFAVVNLRNRMREIRTSIFEELKRLGETFKSDYEIAKQRELGLQKELATAVANSQLTDVNSIALTELESTAQSYKTVYENYLRRYMEGVQEESFPVSEARLISPATRPLHKSSPKTFSVLAVAGLVGMVLGFGIGIWRDLSERVFRTVQQVESLLHTNCIALAPLADPASENADTISSVPDATRRSQTWVAKSLSSIVQRSVNAYGPSEAAKIPAAGSDQDTKIAVLRPSVEITVLTPSVENAVQTPGRKITRNGRLLWSVVDAPLSRFSEAIRSIKLAVDMTGAFKANRVIGFTSSLPNEGKSTIAFSLAQLMAQVGTRTILVDCDLRNPSLSRALAPRARRGLIDVLVGKVEIEKAIWKDRSTNLVFLPAVMKFRYANTSEILSSDPMKKLFEKLRESYDYIVVDLPPLAPIVDVRAATPIVDSFIYVIEWGRTKIDVVEHALGQAQEVYDHLLGVVLNKVDMKSFGRHASHHEGYYYNKHYARYGYTE
jgi:succinoglycan biosynthesis transport protein ExoP